MDIRKQFPRKYMTASDLGGGTLAAQVVSADMVTINTDAVLMLTLRHNEPAPKMVRCNQTNRSVLAGVWGWETDGWVGKKLELSVQPTAMGPGIAMRPINEGQPANPSWTPIAQPPSYPAKPTKPGRTSHIDDDEVPF